MTRPLILLGGRLASGKDTVADYLAATRGYVKHGMSDTLAEALYRLDPIIDHRAWITGHAPDLINGTTIRYRDIYDELGYVEAKQNPEVRRLLQVLGTEVGRELLGENIWVEAAARRIRAAFFEGAAGVMLTGIRFENELALSAIANRLVGVKAVTVWVDRGSHTESGHASENSVGRADFDYTLQNIGTIADLQGAADALLEHVL